MDVIYPSGLENVKALGLGLTAYRAACLDFGMSERRATPSNIDGISERLMLTREAHNLSKSQFADRAGISRTAYHNWEPKPGEKPVGRPNVDQANKLCETYSLTLDWIYRGDRSKLPHDLAEAIDAKERELGLGRHRIEPAIKPEPRRKRA